MSSNPLFEPSKLDFQAPVFDLIKDEHFAPAFDEGMLQQLRELDAIKASKEAPTFQNTLVALEMSGRLLNRTNNVFFNLCAANNSDELLKLQEEYSPKLAAQHDKLFLDSELFARVQAVYDDREKVGLAGEDLRLVEFYLQEFKHAGANLGKSDKTELKKNNEQVASLMAQFIKKLLAATNKGALIVESEAELEGLGEDAIAAAKEAAEKAGHPGKYALRLFNTTQQPLFVQLKNRETRRKLYEASLTRGEKDDDNDTRSTLDQIARLRFRKAVLLGHKCFSDWELELQMADTSSAMKLLHDLVGPASAATDADAAKMQAIANAQGGDFELAAWDWQHYEEQLRKAEYDLDEEELKPYFELWTVLEKGVFYGAEKLYGITFTRRTDLPVYDEDVRVYEVTDHDGSGLALYYFDPFARANKNGGAWCANFIDQSSLLNQRPVVTNVCNYDKPADGKPCLLTQWGVTTMWHEFGHGEQGIFSNLKYPSLSGMAVSRDFVELPSQVNERWATYDEVLRNYAFHHETQEPIPQALVDKMVASATFGGGFETLEVVKAALVDMKWHTAAAESDFRTCAEMEVAALANAGTPLIPGRYHSSFFAHIFGGGYCAGYYAYLWAKLLDSDGFEWFIENGGLTRKNGDHFRKTVLSAGNSKDAKDLYLDFAGRMPGLGPFLRSRGLVQQ